MLLMIQDEVCPTCKTEKTECYHCVMNGGIKLIVEEIKVLDIVMKKIQLNLDENLLWVSNDGAKLTKKEMKTIKDYLIRNSFSGKINGKNVKEK